MSEKYCNHFCLRQWCAPRSGRSEFFLIARSFSGHKAELYEGRIRTRMIAIGRKNNGSFQSDRICFWTYSHFRWAARKSSLEEKNRKFGYHFLPYACGTMLQQRLWLSYWEFSYKAANKLSSRKLKGIKTARFLGRSNYFGASRISARIKWSTNSVPNPR